MSLGVLLGDMFVLFSSRKNNFFLKPDFTKYELKDEDSSAERKQSTRDSLTFFTLRHYSASSAANLAKILQFNILVSILRQSRFPLPVQSGQGEFFLKSRPLSFRMKSNLIL